MTDISREAAVKDKFVDVALKVEGSIRILVEVKAAGETLRDRHTDQAQAYAANSNIKWVLLTNGVAWNLYHLTFDEGIDAVLAYTVDLKEGVDDKGAELLALLHRTSVKKGTLDEYWEHRIALSPASICRALFTEDVLRLLRRKIRKREGISIDEEDLGQAIQEMLSAEARERIGPLKIRRTPKQRSAKASPQPVPEKAPEPKDSETKGE